jgi:hypothetical protein
MRNTLLILACLFVLPVYHTRAQKVYTYQFDSCLHSGSGGPDLAAICAPRYVPHTFGKIVHTVCHFNTPCGFVFNDTSNFLGNGSYTIEMYIELDNTSGYRKLVDYKNQAVDEGLYDNDGACTFRGPGTVSGSFFTNGSYHFVTITRDGTSKDVKMYVDGQYVDGFNDNGFDYAIYDANKMLRILQDDNYSSGTECSPGNIALLKIYNYPLDARTAISHNTAMGLKVLRKLP